MRKNVVFIMSDDQGHWTMGCGGNPDAHTPNLDRLAQHGIRFDNFFCVSPVCSPARASILTGNIPSAHGITDWLDGGDIDSRKYPATNKPLYASEVEAINYLDHQITYTDLLAANGYTCALSGKWHLGNSVEPQHGFDKWFTVPLGHSPYLDPVVIKDGGFDQEKGFLTDIITDKAIEYITELAPESIETDHPFYVSVHYTAPHSPWGKQTQPLEWYEYYKNCQFDSIPFPPMHERAIYTCDSPYFAYGSEAKEPDALRQELLSGYFGAIAAMDKGIGRIIESLDEQGVLQDTIIIFTSDNGMNTGHHGIWGKGNGTYPQNMYDTSVKIPFIINGLDTRLNGKVIDDLYSHYDLMPTLIDLLELQVSDADKKQLDHLPGRSFCQALTGLESSSEDKAIIVYSEYGPVRMIRSKKWKYIHCYPHGPNELYHLENDPDEQCNLIDDDSCQTMIHHMKWQLDRWFLEYVNPAKDATKDDNTGTGQIYLNGIDSEGKKCFENSQSIGVPYMEAIAQIHQQLRRYIEQ